MYIVKDKGTLSVQFKDGKIVMHADYSHVSLLYLLLSQTSSIVEFPTRPGVQQCQAQGLVFCP